MTDTLRISGHRFSLKADAASSWKFEPRPGGWVVATDAAGNRVRLCAQEFHGKLSFAIRGAERAQSGIGEIVAKSHAAGGAGGKASLDADLTAQFPGKVRKILVQAGQSVAAGEQLLLVEAMKMEFAVKAPVSGKVAAIRVREGQQLSPGDRFIDFEPGFDPSKEPNGGD